MNLITVSLTPIAFAHSIAVGMLAGILTVIIVMSLIVSSFAKLPGRGCTRYWASGMALIFVGAIMFMKSRDGNGVAFGVLGFSCLLAGFLIQWQGLRIFHLKQHSPHWREIAALFVVLYGLALLNEFSYAMRLIVISLACISIVSMCVLEIVRHNRARFSVLHWSAIGGGGLMMLSSCIIVLDGLYAGIDIGPANLTVAGLLINVIIPVLGLIIYASSMVVLYFYRIAESTNYAASHDELTGLLNRRAIIQYGRREVEVALRSHQPLTVAFIDIDFFKKINDQYGHDTGDAVLREVAHLLTLTCRSVDLAARYGGEEFCMVFAGQRDSDGGAEGLGERLVSVVRNHQFPGVPRVTISVGLAVLPASATTASWSELVQLADTELYKAKNGGRDRYSVYFDVKEAARSSGSGMALTEAGAWGPKGRSSLEAG